MTGAWFRLSILMLAGGSAVMGQVSPITVQTSVAGLTVIVDGTTFASPAKFNWVAGSTHTLSLSTPQNVGTTSWIFSGWNDSGGLLTHSVVAPATPFTYTASFVPQYQLSTSVGVGGGSIAVQPTSWNGYYFPTATVQLTALPNPNCSFVSFSGDATGTVPTVSVSMSAARSISALFSCRVQALPADSFVDALGVNVHLHFGPTPYVTNFPLVEQMLQQLGTRHIRDGLIDTTWQTYYDHLTQLGALGIKADLITGLGESASVLTSYPSRIPGALEAYEAPNELDISGDSTWVADLRAFQKFLYSTVKGNAATASYPVIGPSLTSPQAFTSLGDLSSFMDYGNLHNYFGGRNPGTSGWGSGGYGSIPYNLALAGIVDGNKPILTTETGYISVPTINQGIPEAIEGRYAPRVLLNQIGKGIARTYLYELIDEGTDRTNAENNFGLLRNDGSAKPAFTALANLNQLLKDPGTSFQTGQLSYAVSGQTNNVNQALFQRRDGTFYLVLWIELPGFDVNAQQAIQVPNQAVTVTLSQATGTPALITLDDSGADSTATLPVVNGAVNVTLSDRVSVIVFPPSAPASVKANTGTTPQSAQVNTAFANAPAVTVQDANGQPLSGVSVVFAAPATGASGFFSNNAATMTVVSDAAGSAVALFSANSIGGGPYSVTATVAGLPPVLFSFTNLGVSNANGATYVGLDTKAQGHWGGVFGSDGYLIANDANAPPSYADVSFSGSATWTWVNPTSDVRALQTAASATARIASTFYSTGSSMNVNVNLTDGKAHRVALYLLDWDTTARTETISILDGTTHAVLDTETFASFQNGGYAVWNLRGNVIVQVTRTGGINAVVAGIFFDGASGGTPVPPVTSGTATYSGLDTATQGAWTAKYGADGDLIASYAVNVPSYASVKMSGQSLWTWTSSTTDPRALQTSGGTGIASTYYGASFSVNVNVTDGKAHRMALYLLDWDTTQRAETISILDAGTKAVLDTETFANFHNGGYAVWTISGNVTVQVTGTAGYNGVIAGIFFDTAGGVTVPATATVSYNGQDATTEGAWTAKYGADGDWIAGYANNSPSYATVSLAGDSVWTWTNATNDVRALATGGGTGVASAYYGSSFTVNVSLTDGKTHAVSLYLLDWDTTNRAETIAVLDAGTGVVLDTERFAGFHGGVYGSWNVKGNVIFQVTGTAGYNGVVSGVFFGGR